MQLISLLHQKLVFLKQFLQVSSELLEHLDKNDFSTLNEFELVRAEIIGNLVRLDKEIKECIKTITHKLPPETLDQVRHYDTQLSQCLERILITDKSIISKVIGEKARILKEIQASKNSIDKMKKFRSEWIPEAGSTLDGKL